jgi:hypothetical protein
LLGHLAGIQRALEGQLDVMRYLVSFPCPCCLRLHGACVAPANRV